MCVCRFTLVTAHVTVGLKGCAFCWVTPENVMERPLGGRLCRDKDRERRMRERKRVKGTRKRGREREGGQGAG